MKLGSGATALVHKSMSSRRQIQLADIILFGDADRWQTAKCNPKKGFSLWLRKLSTWKMQGVVEGYIESHR